MSLPASVVPVEGRWKVVPQSRTGGQETPCTEFTMCLWHEQLPRVIGIGLHGTSQISLTALVFRIPIKSDPPSSVAVRQDRSRFQLKLAAFELYSSIPTLQLHNLQTFFCTTAQF